MLTKTTAIAAAAAFTATIGTAQHAWAEAYQLNFDAPRQVGDTFEIRGSGSSMQEVFTRVNGQTVEEVANHGEAMVHARGEVLALNDEGGVSQVAYELIEYEFEFNSDALELDTSKRLIATAVDGEVTYTYEDGEAVGEGFEDALDVVLDMPIDTEADGEDTNIIMNTQVPREVGEEWEMNHEYMAQQMSDSGELSLDPEDIRSHVRLVEVTENEAGAAMATIESQATATNLNFAAGQLPPFMKLVDSALSFQVNGQLALDPATVYGVQHMEMEIAWLAKGKTPEGDLVEIEVEYEREAEVSYAPIAD